MNAKVYSAPVPKMPLGLIELMEGLAKDVLKNNPPDIFDFCSLHMEKLIKIRDGDVTKNGLTLSQKITRAQEKVRQRYEIRQKCFVKDSLNVGEENQIRFKRESFSPDIEPIYNQEMSTEISIEDKDKLDKPEDITVHDVNVEAKRETEFNHLDVKYQVDTSIVENKQISTTLEVLELIIPDELQNEVNEEAKREDKNSEISCLVEDRENTQISTNLEVLNLNSKNTLDELQHVVANYDNLDYSNGYSKNSKDENEFIGIETDLAEKENLANVKTNAITGDVCNQTCLTVTLVENENNYISANEDVHINSKIYEKKNETTNYIPVEDVTNISNETNADQESEVQLPKPWDYFDQEINIQMSKNAISEDSIITEVQENSSNNSDKSVTTLDDNNVSTEKDSNNETQNDFSNDMDLEKAAITIQKVFRSFLFRSKTSSVDDATNVDLNLLIEDTNNENHEDFGNETISNDKRPLGLSRMDTVLQTVNEEKSLSLSTDDSSTLSSAATIIQAHVRGFLVRNKLNFNKTISTASNIDSDIQSPKSLDKDLNNSKNKTILNIHIVPEGGNYLSRDESFMTSIDLPLDGSPPHSSNLHPLGYDKNERRKQLKREDAIQSISPPSNNSGKSEDMESVKTVLPHLTDPQVGHLVQSAEGETINNSNLQLISNDKVEDIDIVNDDDRPQSGNQSSNQRIKLNDSTENTTDELDVITPYVAIEDNGLMDLNKSRLLHSGEFHDIVLPTMVSRSNTSVVREFQNVFVYFLLWNNP